MLPNWANGRIIQLPINIHENYFLHLYWNDSLEYLDFELRHRGGGLSGGWGNWGGDSPIYIFLPFSLHFQRNWNIEGKRQNIKLFIVPSKYQQVFYQSPLLINFLKTLEAFVRLFPVIIQSRKNRRRYSFPAFSVLLQRKMYVDTANPNHPIGA